MSDSEDIYDSPAAPTPAHQSKVSQLARMFESNLKAPIQPKPAHGARLEKIVLPVTNRPVPDMALARKRLRPVSAVPEAIAPAQSPIDRNGAVPETIAHAHSPISRDSDVSRTSRSSSSTKRSIRESLYPPEVGPKAEVRPPSVGQFRMMPLPSQPEVTPPAKPDIIDVDLDRFLRYVTDDGDDIYDDVADQPEPRDSFDSRTVSLIPEITEFEDLNETGTRGTIFEEIASEPEEDDYPVAEEEEYDDVIEEELYQNVE